VNQTRHTSLLAVTGNMLLTGHLVVASNSEREDSCSMCVISHVTFNSTTEGCGLRQESVHRRRLRVASGATAPGPAFEGAPRFRAKVIH
jgi:hypothetical protein